MGMDMEINSDNVEQVVVTKIADKQFTLEVPIANKTSQMWAKDLLKNKADLEANLVLINKLIAKAGNAGVDFTK